MQEKGLFLPPLSLLSLCWLVVSSSCSKLTPREETWQKDSICMESSISQAGHTWLMLMVQHGDSCVYVIGDCRREIRASREPFHSLVCRYCCCWRMDVDGRKRKSELNLSRREERCSANCADYLRRHRMISIKYLLRLGRKKLSLGECSQFW